MSPFLFARPYVQSAALVTESPAGQLLTYLHRRTGKRPTQRDRWADPLVRKSSGPLVARFWIAGVIPDGPAGRTAQLGRFTPALSQEGTWRWRLHSAHDANGILQIRSGQRLRMRRYTGLRGGGEPQAGATGVIDPTPSRRPCSAPYHAMSWQRGCRVSSSSLAAVGGPVPSVLREPRSSVPPSLRSFGIERWAFDA